MTDELGREELRTIVDDVFRSWENIDEKYHKARWQIIELIQKPGVTEEQIEEKALELNNEILLESHRRNYYKVAKNFILSLVEVMPAKTAGVDKDWLPTPENINALPEPVRKYIYDIRTNCDPAGMVRENVLIKDTCKMLVLKLEEKKEEEKAKKGFPKIVCLCGSTRFTEAMLILQWGLTKQGFIVLSWCALPESYFKNGDQFHIGDKEGVKEIVDEVHLRKIDLAEEVLILNVDGYIGESTQNELNYAKKKRKVIRFLEPQEK